MIAQARKSPSVYAAAKKNANGDAARSRTAVEATLALSSRETRAASAQKAASAPRLEMTSPAARSCPGLGGAPSVKSLAAPAISIGSSGKKLALCSVA
jgi:hypothetical protein